MGWKKAVKQASADGSLTKAEIKSIKASYGVTGNDVRAFADTKGITYETKSNMQEGEQQSAFQNLYDFQAGLLNIQAGATTTSTTIRAEADKEIAKIDADARKYGYDLGLEGTKYTADKESEWRQAVSNIEVKGKLDLQPIINAGLERVAEIEGQSAKDVADITGKYSLRSMQERTKADKALGKMQLAGGMYGLIGSVFG